MVHVHGYDCDLRPTVPVGFVAAFAGITLSSLVGQVIDGVNAHWGMALGSLSAFTVYLGMLKLVDRVLWKIPALKTFLKVPNIQGTWELVGETTKMDGAIAPENEWRGVLHVEQSWTRISVQLQTPTSTSESVSAAMYSLALGQWRLVYVFRNRPEPGNVITAHEGVCELRFDASLKRAEGFYYSDHNRSNVGKLSLERSVSNGKN